MGKHKLTETAAEEIVAEHGPKAVPILRRHAELADEQDDGMAGDTLREIADNAEDLLREPDSGRPRADRGA